MNRRLHCGPSLGATLIARARAQARRPKSRSATRACRTRRAARANTGHSGQRRRPAARRRRCRGRLRLERLLLRDADRDLGRRSSAPSCSADLSNATRTGRGQPAVVRRARGRDVPALPVRQRGRAELQQRLDADGRAGAERGRRPDRLRHRRHLRAHRGSALQPGRRRFRSPATTTRRRSKGAGRRAAVASRRRFATRTWSTSSRATTDYATPPTATT